jgi:cyanophycinase
MTKIVSLAALLLPLVSAVALAVDRHDNHGSAKSTVRAKSQPEQRPGPLVIVGGGGTPESVGRHFVKLSGGRQARIAVLPQASSRPDRGASSVKMFQSLGSQSFIVNLEDLRSARERIESATAIWFPGGSQSALYKALDKAGLVSLIRRRHARGLVVGGTSAGAAVMSAVMISRSPETQTLRSGNTPSASGLGLVPGLIIDQHFVRRRRMNRLVGIVLDQPGRIGVGIGEATAIVVSGGRFRVLGRNSVIVVDPREARVDRPAARGLQSATGLQLHVLKAGQEFRFQKED